MTSLIFACDPTKPPEFLSGRPGLAERLCASPGSPPVTIRVSPRSYFPINLRATEMAIRIVGEMLW